MLTTTAAMEVVDEDAGITEAKLQPAHVAPWMADVIFGWSPFDIEVPEEYLEAAPSRAVRPNSDWVKEVLQAHNRRRARHQTPPLVWSDDCYDQAAYQASQCMQQGVSVRGAMVSAAGPHGQNHAGPLRQRKPDEQQTLAGVAERCVKRWYQQLRNYDFSEPRVRHKTADFVQMVWFSTTSVGMAISPDGRFCVANYFPPANPHANLRRNVLPVCTFPTTGALAWSTQEEAKEPSDAGSPKVVDFSGPWDAPAGPQKPRAKPHSQAGSSGPNTPLQGKANWDGTGERRKLSFSNAMGPTLSMGTTGPGSPQMDMTRSLSGFFTPNASPTPSRQADRAEMRAVQSAPTRDQKGLDSRRPGKLDTRKSMTSPSLPPVKGSLVNKSTTFGALGETSPASDTKAARPRGKKKASIKHQNSSPKEAWATAEVQ
mmetsp:Transcript_35925/g.65960  ORF Transcript_35925/g.65960 Transcript_35925/m.65960 type:complete len:428 (-) Transcript_35925:41-1324(-)